MVPRGACQVVSRWQDKFARGQSVEARVLLATGAEWRPAVVCRKTATGFPVVAVPELTCTIVVDRKSDIRCRAQGANK